jgi:DNA/RNA endonuclease G (NUC1)
MKANPRVAERRDPLTPRQIYNYLDRYVVGQERAKRSVAIAAYNHLKRCGQPTTAGKRLIKKSNLLLLGPTGSGKTHIARTLARCLDVPFTVADASAKARKPDPNADTTRKGLTGLRKNDQEKWFTDPRIPEEHQLPDVFFTKDRQAFDKGHIVRRDDVCWGKTFAQLRRANGDTFHTTNCSPQVLDFNRSNKGGRWGELENMILKQAKTEKLSLFAGPVLDDEDDVFEGVDDRGPVSVPIPRRYWKIVFANAGGALQAFAFILEQDLSDVALEPEFAVGAAWVPHMISIQDLQDTVSGLTFAPAVHKADQFGAGPGDEIAVEAELKKS